MVYPRTAFSILGAPWLGYYFLFPRQRMLSLGMVWLPFEMMWVSTALL